MSKQRVIDGDPLVLRWFTGKAQQRAKEALTLLEASLDADEWLPGVSRKVRAALNKCNVAHKFGRANDPIFREIKTPSEKRKGAYSGMAGDLARAMMYGYPQYLLGVDTDALWKAVKTEEQRQVLGYAQTFYDDFRTIAEAMKMLDETRPKPVFTALGVSPTITKTLKECNLDLDTSTVRWPPIAYRTVEGVDAKGNRVRRREPYIKWPKGTVHHASRFTIYGNTGSCPYKCEACGHGIKNAGNWVPVLIDDKKGKPHSLWVGRDCAWNVFGIKVTGELNFKEEDRK